MQDEGLLEIAREILRPHGLTAVTCKVTQNLWAGYGTISEVKAMPEPDRQESDAYTFIMKCVKPPVGSKQDEGYLRKLLSYEVEQHFYSELSEQLPKEAAVSKCLGTVTQRSGDQVVMAMVLEDLREAFPIAGEKRTELSVKQTYAALDWLACFHGSWWKRRQSFEETTLKRPPVEEGQRLKTGDSNAGNVWLNGGYSYLATRQKEYASLRADVDSEWFQALCTPCSPSNKSIAELAADVLSPSKKLNDTSPYETLIHGDVKSENLFTTASGDKVAFFDFQYVGIGLGVGDLAKFMTCSVPLSLLTLGKADNETLSMGSGEKELLNIYHSQIQEISGLEYPWRLLELHWNTALVDWLRFQACWGFWGNTAWLEARVRCILQDQGWRKWLLSTVGSGGQARPDGGRE